MTTSASTPPTPPHFRTWLAELSDTQLEALLSNRADVLHPLPPGIAPLATRLTLRTSVARALAECNAQQLAALEDIAERGGELREVEDTTPDITQQLKERGLAYNNVMIPTDVMPALPTEWTLLHQQEVPALEELPEDEAHILATLARSGGTGTTRDAASDADPARPIPRLLAKGILIRVDSHTVRLPRAVHRALAGHTTQLIPITPSGRAGTPLTNAKADEAGAAAGLGVVRGVEQLLSALGSHPVELLKDKTVGVRPQAQLAKRLAMEETEVRRLVTLGLAARLLSRGEPKGLEGNFLAPTRAATEWLDADLADKWAVLIEATLASPWAPWDEGRLLAEQHERLPRHRQTVLDVYRNSAVPLTKEEFWEDLRFRSPLFVTHTHAETITQLVAEAEWMGLIAHGQITRAETAPRELTPETVDYFLIQADLTVLVPGPLEPQPHATLAAMADLESPGLASVFRISDSSLRRAMDHGMTPEEIEAFLAEFTSEVPHTLSFLIRDVARRHGTLRSGPALAYLRSEDPALLEMAARAVPGLRLIAPTVAISQQRCGELLEQLRAAGLSPSAEDESGASLNVAPEPYALPTPSPRKRATEAVDVAKAVSAIRASAIPPEEGPDLDVLHAAVRGQRQVVIVYADKNGNPQERVVTPVSVSGGQVDAVGSDGSALRFPMHRVNSVTIK